MTKVYVANRVNNHMVHYSMAAILGAKKIKTALKP